MTDVKGRGGHRAALGHDAIDFGDDPPLLPEGNDANSIDRRRVSVQWLSGTILTGLCGAALMGGAVFAALDGATNFADEPELITGSLRGAVSERFRKSDKLPAATETNVARHTIRISTTHRVGDREMIRVRPYVRVAANLSLSVTQRYAASIPPFNPQRLLAEVSGTAIEAETPNGEPDAEVSFVQRDLAALLPRARIKSTLAADAVITRVRDVVFSTGSATRVASAQPGGETRMAYAADVAPDPYVGFEARIVPENVTLLPKTSAQATNGANSNERMVAFKKGDTFTSVLTELGATADDIRQIAAALGPRGRDGNLKEGHRLRVLLAPPAPGQRLQPARVMVVGDSGVEAVAALSDLNRWVAVDVQAVVDTQVAEAEEDEDDSRGVRLYQSFYETALRNNIPRHVIEEMVRIYSYDVDFQRRAQAGDSFEVLYAGEDESPESRNDVQFAALTVGGETRRYYRFQTPDDSVVDFYDETGKSAKKFLVRKPLASGLMRSGFGSRKHPILGYVKMHTGVDWAAPMGTPIYASGNGTVATVGWESGYGKYVRIRHANGYETAYGHMTAYARGMEPGVRVRQGQVIGFVGSTGLSTGAHLHYEIIVNGRFVDPMRVRLPRGRVLEGPLLAGFEKDRVRIDGMLAKAPSRVAQNAQPERK